MDDEEDRPQGFMAKLVDFIRSWGPAIFAVLFVRTFVIEPFRIPSGSMVPTLQIGDHVAVSKFSYGIWVPYTIVEIPFLDYAKIIPRFRVIDFGGPKRGDIIVFRYPRAEEVNYIKRVVAIPGDRIRVENNQIFLNGEAQSFEYQETVPFVNSACQTAKTKLYIEDLEGLKHEALTSTSLGGPLEDMREKEIPPGHVFVMGDNRDYSEDSRRWGLVRDDQIKGKAHVVLLSWDGCGTSTGGMRMDRFFHNLYSL